MPTPPAVSVVIPTRDRAGLLPRAVRSVLGQSFPDLELLVVDDASTDGTRSVSSALAASDPRVRVVHLPRPVGGAEARNRGIALAKGELVAFLDDDDEYLPEKLELQVEVLRSAPREVGVCYAPCLYVDAGGAERVLPTTDLSGAPARRRLLERNCISTPTVLVRRSLLSAVQGFDARLPRFQDWDLWVRLAGATRFAFVPRPVARAYHSRVSISTSSAALVEAVRLLERKLETEMRLSREELADGLHALGHLLMVGGAPEEGPRLLRRALRERPWPPQRVLGALLAELGPGPYGALSALHRRWVEG